MKGLNIEQKKHLKGITSKTKRNKTRKAFLSSNEKCKVEAYKMFFEDLFNVVRNPLFLKLIKR